MKEIKQRNNKIGLIWGYYNLILRGQESDGQKRDRHPAFDHTRSP